MKLTEADKKLLSAFNYEKEDFPQIEETMSTVKLKSGDGKRIGLNEAIQILGRSDFISGIARCAFHFSALREARDGRKVIFDNSKMFAAIVKENEGGAR